MGMDSLASVEARIASIQTAFVAPAVMAPISSSTASLATANQPNSFASALAQVTGSQSLTGIPTSQLGSQFGSTTATGSAAAFVRDAESQAGKPYIFGAEANPSDPNPKAFDCSELVQWSAQRQGVTLPDGSWQQYLQLKAQGHTMSVDQALHTPGALLFSFSHEPVPGGGRPSEAHVAISLGDGRTIEARGKKYGVGEFSGVGRFSYGATIPGLENY